MTQIDEREVDWGVDALRAECATSDFHDYDGCDCSYIELLRRKGRTLLAALEARERKAAMWDGLQLKGQIRTISETKSVFEVVRDTFFSKEKPE